MVKVKTCNDCDMCFTNCKNKRSEICNKFVDKYKIADDVSQELGWKNYNNMISEEM